MSRFCDHLQNGQSAWRTMSRWEDTADRPWREDECKKCGLLRRFVDGKFWRPPSLRSKKAA